MGDNAGGVWVDDINLSTNIICYARGTQIEIAAGTVCAVEDLKPGDLVLTADEGLKPLRRVGARLISDEMLASNPKLRPVRVAAGALGAGMPSHDPLLSPQHRVVLRSEIVNRIYAEQEILVAAKHLCGLPGISFAEDIAEAEYFHFLFDGHQIVYSNGAATESLYPGPQALLALESEQIEEFSRSSLNCEIAHVLQTLAPLNSGKGSAQSGPPTPEPWRQFDSCLIVILAG